MEEECNFFNCSASVSDDETAAADLPELTATAGEYPANRRVKFAP
jgi:hypothetical protein